MSPRLPVRAFHALDNDASKGRKFAAIHAALMALYDAERDGKTDEAQAIQDEFRLAGISLAKSPEGKWLWEQVL